jgi:hypothetical protein
MLVKINSIKWEKNEVSFRDEWYGDGKWLRNAAPDANRLW